MILLEILNTRRLDGYRARAPSALIAAEDAAICAELACEQCGHQGLHYRPFSRPGSYIMVAHCSACDWAVEL